MYRRAKFIAVGTSIAAFLLAFPPANAQDKQATADAYNSALETCTPSTHRIPSLLDAFGLDLIGRVNIRGYDGENCIVDYTFATHQEPYVEASYLLCAYSPETIERLVAMSEVAQAGDRSEESSDSGHIDITIDGEDAFSGDENTSVDVTESCENNETWFEELDMQMGAMTPQGEQDATEPESLAIGAVQEDDIQTATLLEIARIDQEEKVLDMRFSPNSRYLVAIAHTTAWLWEVETNQEVARFDLESWSYSFSPNSRYLATNSGDKTVQVWDIEANREVARFTHDRKVYDVKFSPDSRYLVTAGGDNAARVWNIEANQEVVHFTHGGDVYSAQFSSDGRYLATASEDATARVWDIETNQEVVRFGNERKVTGGREGYERIMSDARFSPDGRYLAISTSETTAQVWDIETSQEIVRFVHEGPINRGWSFDVHFSPNGRYAVATAETAEIAQVSNLEANGEIARIAHNPYSPEVRFSPNSRYLATVSSNETAQVWDLETNQAVAHITHGEFVLDVRFSPNNRYVATAGRDQGPTYRISTTLEGTARVWDIEANQEVASISYEGLIEAIRFSPNGRYLATYSTDYDYEEGIVQVWDLESPQE